MAHDTSRASKVRRNPQEGDGECHDPYSEVKKRPCMYEVYEREAREMDGFAKRAARGVNPTQCNKQAREEG